MMRKLPLFPLSTVVFPGASLPLHIFEGRYRLMISRCLEEQAPFGVVLIQSGEEVGGPASFHSVGTIVEIVRSERLDDGRYLLETVGRRRFRFQYYVQRSPYIIGSVAPFPEISAPGSADQGQALRALYVRYWDAVTRATGETYEVLDLSDDVIEMTYQLAHRMEVQPLLKQRWLEADVATRLREISTVLRQELALLPNMSSGRAPGHWPGIGSWN